MDIVVDTGVHTTISNHRQNQLVTHTHEAWNKTNSIPVQWNSIINYAYSKHTRIRILYYTDFEFEFPFP